MDHPVRGTRLVPGKLSFVDLAPELQSMIMEFLVLSICPLTVPCDAKTKYYPITSAGEQSLLNLKLSCRMIYNAIKEKRFIEAFTIVQPQPHRSEWDPSQGAVIFRPSRKAFTINPFVPDLQLAKLWIPGFCFDERFRQTGDPPTNGIAPGQHIGEVWNNGATSPPPGPNEYRCPTSGAMVPSEPPARPLVGLYGYDKTETTRGGFWAGFLYYPLKREVWFSPLSAPEIRDATHVPVADKPERKLFEGTHSDFVARVWIIRKDQDLPAAQPHHRWVRVKSDQPGDPRYTGEIELMWSIVVHRVLKQTQGETPYELRVAQF
ncbi:hypothetical protein FPCIR_5454 [Fusarium pseudocircinatum]|uniref:Uncharacterized protein n=1 Tax=Fusarium pseudocircinatum TaxID=56676 RepID=A0A8H5ULF7_9HYPO|nr:hypothetical protein FPCIR_5454 [Fusarium pseudocircinatum]